MKKEMILVLDFGSQYNQLIVRRIRELGVYSELHSNTANLSEIAKKSDIKGIILSGGPNSVYEEDALVCSDEVFDLNIPVLGICYGMQLIHHKLGGKVIPCEKKEYGKAEITIEHESFLFKNIPETQTVWMSHGDQVMKLANSFIGDASSKTCIYAASSDEKKKIYTVQFHPEVSHTDFGFEILKNFVFEICQCKRNWSMHNFINENIKQIKQKVGNQHVLLALSGGVDSSVVAALLNKAIGKQLYCVFVDHGLLRKNEANDVVRMIKENMNIHFIKVDAKAHFLNKLKGITDPEQKRKIIGNEFIHIFTEEAKKISKENDLKWLAQGTLYTDIIESGTHTAQTIKSHHNVGGLPNDLNFKLIEPLNTLFKDEVRKLGIELGLTKEMVYRQPFPGPGLAIRIIGEVTEEKIEIVKESDAILQEEIKKAKLHNSIWQYFTVLTNIQSVGVMGDQRTYDYTIAIRAVTSIDGMTCDFAKIPYDVLTIISNRIVNEVKHVNRVVYDITSKPPATIEFE